jgi:cyclomaltodextrinase
MSEESFVFGELANPEYVLAKRRCQLAGIYHGSHINPTDPWPGEPVTLLIESGHPLRPKAIYVYYTTDGTIPRGHHGRASNGLCTRAVLAEPRWDALTWRYVDRWQTTLPGQPAGTFIQYVIEADCGEAGSMWADGSWLTPSLEQQETSPPTTNPTTLFIPPAEGDSEHPALGPSPTEPGEKLGVRGHPTRFGYTVDELEPPSWVWDAVIYQIIPDRFYPGDGRTWNEPASVEGFYGGTLDGVGDKLAYLESLGVNCLWLTPIFESPSYHGYDATDYRHVAERLGGDEALRRLVTAAHIRGIRVLLDLAINHCSNQHPFFHHAQHHRQSPYHDWFIFREWPDDYESFFGVLQLPKWNNERSEARAYMLETASYWLREFGVDGYRLDHAIGPSLATWSEFRLRTRAAAPESLTIGEVTLGPDDLRHYTGRMDGCLDFPLLQAFRQFFITRSIDAAAFDSFLARQDGFYWANFVRPTFLDNHDMNRFLWSARGDKRLLRLAAVCQFTQPQPPIIYYGTEVGLSQEADVREQGLVASRLPMRWDEQQDKELLDFYRRLIAIRRTYSALRDTVRRTFCTKDGLYGYSCMTHEGPTVHVVLNNSNRRREVLLPHPLSGTELLSGQQVTRPSLELGPFDAALVATNDTART